jgi:hypothetical protein
VVQKVLTTLSFIGGRLRQPGETVDFDDENPTLAIPAPSSSLAQLSNDEIEAYLKRRRGEEDKDAAKRLPSNLAEPTAENTGTTTVPIADITVRSGASGRPQGIPAGSVEINGQFVAPAPEGAAAPVEAYVGTPGASTGTPDLSGLDLDNSGEPGGSLTKAEIVQALRDRGDDVDTSASKADLQKQLSAPPKA